MEFDERVGSFVWLQVDLSEYGNKVDTTYHEVISECDRSRWPDDKKTT